MRSKKKLQVFVSSTFADLRVERQAAVEAILTAGHIPAGMELFAAGDESQMQVIRRWIDQSDVFLLILGARYGSLEPTTQKSYVHLEYEYALAKHKPLFAVVIANDAVDPKVRRDGTGAIETGEPGKLREFRATVEGRMVRYWREEKDIKLAILEALPGFTERGDVIGWVRADESANIPALADEVARLSRENAELRDRLAGSGLAPISTYNGLTFEQLYDLLAKMKLSTEELTSGEMPALEAIAEAFGDPEPGALHVFVMLSARLMHGAPLEQSPLLHTALHLQEIGLVKPSDPSWSLTTFTSTDLGQRFLLRLRRERDFYKIEQYRVSR